MGEWGRKIKRRGVGVGRVRIWWRDRGGGTGGGEGGGGGDKEGRGGEEMKEMRRNQERIL